MSGTWNGNLKHIWDSEKDSVTYLGLGLGFLDIFGTGTEILKYIRDLKLVSKTYFGGISEKYQTYLRGISKKYQKVPKSTTKINPK